MLIYKRYFYESDLVTIYNTFSKILLVFEWFKKIISLLPVYLSILNKIDKFQPLLYIIRDTIPFKKKKNLETK